MTDRWSIIENSGVRLHSLEMVFCVFSIEVLLISRELKG